MRMYREAAADSFKRQISVYGLERVSSIALASGYRLDSNGNILSVAKEEGAFDSLCVNVKREFGPLAALSCRTALIKASSRETNAIMQHIASSVADINKSLSFFKLPEEKGVISNTSEAVAVPEELNARGGSMKFERGSYPSIGFFQKVFGWAF